MVLVGSLVPAYSATWREHKALQGGGGRSCAGMLERRSTANMRQDIHHQWWRHHLLCVRPPCMRSDSWRCVMLNICRLCCMLVIPDFPRTTKWLTPEEKAYATYRLKMDAEEDDDSHSTTIWEGLRFALLDWRLYVFIAILHSNVLRFVAPFPSFECTLC